MNQGNLSFAERVAGWERVFRCPVCLGPMRVVDGKSLVCSGNHCFDLSRKGYVNFLSRPVASQYGKQLFASRAILFQHGFFAPLASGCSMTERNDFSEKCVCCMIVVNVDRLEYLSKPFRSAGVSIKIKGQVKATV